MVNNIDDYQLNKRTSKGKQKIDIKKIDKKSSRQVAFSKRRNGLFKKCSTLCTDYGSKFALITFSEAGNPFVSGYPSAEAVIQCFLADSRNNVVVESEPITSCLSSNDKWWENPIDDMSLDELQRFKIALQDLKKDNVSRVYRFSRANKASNGVHLSSFSNEIGNSNLGDASNGSSDANEIIDSISSDANNGTPVSHRSDETVDLTLTLGPSNSSNDTEIIDLRYPDARNRSLEIIDFILRPNHSNESTESVNVGSNNANDGVQEPGERLDVGWLKLGRTSSR